MDAGTVAIAVAQAVIQAMTTELWAAIRTKIASSLAGCRGHDEVLAELDTTAELVRGAPQAREAAERQWTRKVSQLLTEDPHVVADLHRLVEEITRALGTTAPSGDVHQVAVTGRDAVQIGHSRLIIQQPVQSRRRWRR
jgi:hypothetical protein